DRRPARRGAAARRLGPGGGRGVPGTPPARLGGARDRRRARATRRLAAAGGDDLGRLRRPLGVGQRPLGQRRHGRLEAAARPARVPRSAPQPVRRAARRAAPRAGLTAPAGRALAPRRPAMQHRRNALHTRVQRRCNAAVVDYTWVQRTDRGETVITVQTRGSRRGLSTARAALQVAWLLAARPEGVRADEVAETLGRSVSTAYNLLASLCEEGVAEHHPGGLYRLTPGFRDVVATGVTRPAELHDLSAVADDLLARTHKRSYVGLLRG